MAAILKNGGTIRMRGKDTIAYTQKKISTRLRPSCDNSPQSRFYAFFNNHARGQAVANALMLQGALLSSDQIRAPHSLLEAFPELDRFLVGDRANDLDFN